MADFRRNPGEGAQKGLPSRGMGRLIEATQLVTRLQNLRDERRCPRNPRLTVDSCHLCQLGEQGHGIAVVDQDLANAQQDVAQLRRELPAR